MHSIHIGKDELKVDGLHIPNGVYAAIHMGDVAVLKAANHVYNGIYLPNVREKFISQAFSLAGPFD